MAKQVFRLDFCGRVITVQEDLLLYVMTIQ